MGAKRLVGAKRPGGKRPGGKRLGGETTRGGNGLGAKRPGFRIITGMDRNAPEWTGTHRNGHP